MPHAPTVFPDRDFVSADGYAANKDMRITVLRNGVKIGEAFGRTDNAGLVEVNHPGGVCWSGSTPNIIAGDQVIVAEAADPVDVGDAVSVSNVTAEPAAKELDALGQPTGRVIVRGRAVNSDGSAMDLGSIEQRIVNPDLAAAPPAGVGKRNVRAVLGDGLSADSSMGVGGFIAVYDSFSDHIDDLIVNGQTRVLTWQGVNPAGDRLGISIHEVGEVGGPGFGGCPGGSNYAVTGSNHPAVTKAMKDAGTSLVVSGAARDASTVAVTLSDGTHTAGPVDATLDVPAPANQTWTAAFTAADLARLDDGTLTASAVYTVGPGTVPGVERTIVKDTVAPGRPDATPGGGTFEGPQAVTLGSPDPAATVHYSVNGSTPSAASPTAPAQLMISSSQTVNAIAVDPVGNTSGVSTYTYVIAPRLGSTAVQVIPAAGAAAAPKQAVLPSVAQALSVSRLSLSRRISITRLRVQGLRASMSVPDGTNVVRIAIYRARNGQKAGRALLVTNRVPRAAGPYRVTFRTRSLLSKLRTGSYVMETQAGRSAASLGGATRVTFTVAR